jgi:hypothetical protein
MTRTRHRTRQRPVAFFQEIEMNDIDDYDVFDGMRWLLRNNVDLDDQLAVERALWTPFYCTASPVLKERFIKSCVQAAVLNKESFGRLGPPVEYFAPAEDAS